MDPAQYKTLTTKRGFVYNYYSLPSKQGKHTLLFLHGYPSTSGTWAPFVAFFEARGYGIIVPDLLGFGGTDKPTDAKLFVSSGIVSDVVDILDAEKVDKVIAIGHDWGVRVESRLATYAPDRVLGYAFVCIPYTARNTLSNYTQSVQHTTALLGYDPYGYMLFLSGDAEHTQRAHIDSFINIFYPLDPKSWLTKLTDVGALQKALEEDFRTALPPYVTEEYIENWKKYYLQKDGLASPNQWYTVLVSGLEAVDESNTKIPQEQEFPPKSAPIFFAAAETDYICVPKLADEVWALPQFKDHKITRKSYDADHWVVLSKAKELSIDLEEWLKQFDAV